MKSDPKVWRRAILESPYAGDVENNRLYAWRCLRDMFERGEAGFASHLLYTRLFPKYSQEQREEGLAAGAIWTPAAEHCVVYEDFGVTKGMKRGIANAESCNIPILRRRLGPT